MTPERRSEVLISACFAVTTLAAVALAVVYATGGQPQLEGALLAVAFGGLAAGAVLLAHRLLPAGGMVQPRHELDTPDAEDDALEHDLGRGGLARRRLITRTFTTAVGALAVAALFPIRSLGPRPGGALSRTSWRAGRRMVTKDGRLVRAEDVPIDSMVTAYPEGFRGVADSQVVLVRVDPDALPAQGERAGWSPGGLLCFSKVCTHAGCPVGLYTAERHELLCPCHQSAFDVLDQARPIFGPAAVPLPQLPLRVNEDGIVEARGDFSAPVGPAFWHHT